MGSMCEVSMCQTRESHARPLGSRLLLPQGLLRTSKLRFSTCQGIDRLIQISSELYRLWCKSTIANLRRISASLHGAPQISHLNFDFVFSGTNCVRQRTQHGATL